MTRPEPVFIFSQKTAERQCPVCDRILDAVTSMTLDPSDPNPRMKVDDITCCAYCGTILLVTTLGFRPASEAEIQRLATPLRHVLFEWTRRHDRTTH